jgi:hypothetical protein
MRRAAVVAFLVAGEPGAANDAYGRSFRPGSNRRIALWLRCHTPRDHLSSGRMHGASLLRYGLSACLAIAGVSGRTIGWWDMNRGIAAAPGDEAYRQLASYRRCAGRIETAWPVFAARRRQRLRQGLFGAPVEKVAENIVEDLFTSVLDWSLDDVNLQVGRADVVLSDHGYKRLVLEVKRPGSLIWHRRAIQAALEQAMGYAAAQNVAAVAVSDGDMLYVADVAAGGGMRCRTFAALDLDVPPLDLWWVSVHGLYRPCPAVTSDLTWPAASVAPAPVGQEGGLRDHRYHLPSRCFAYVGSAADADTWKLPYLLESGVPDTKRLPKAIQSILSNYRGAKVTIPREAVPDALVRLVAAAATLRKLPCQCSDSAAAYVQAHHALEQFDRLADVGCCPLPRRAVASRGVAVECGYGAAEDVPAGTRAECR